LKKVIWQSLNNRSTCGVEHHAWEDEDLTGNSAFGGNAIARNTGISLAPADLYDILRTLKTIYMLKVTGALDITYKQGNMCRYQSITQQYLKKMFNKG